MGLAKYAEDNFEIYLERIYYQKAKAEEPQFQVTATVLPTAIPVKISVSVQRAKSPKNNGKTIECCDCGRKFLFTTGEQRFYASHNLHTPKRCKACGQINKRIAERRFWNVLL